MPRTFSMYQVDAFTSRIFEGNPAAVLILDEPLDKALMQSIAAENNLSETVFAVPAEEGCGLRWFTPTHEAPFCGHATLAAAHVLIAEQRQPGPVTFQTQVGALEVAQEDEGYILSLPAYPPEPFDEPPGWLEPLFGSSQIDSFCNFENMFVVLADEGAVRSFEPDLSALADTYDIDLCITAEGQSTDFVSRYFAPRAGIPEDPVTGSTHATLTPYWAHKLGRNRLSARQCSPRGGDLIAELAGDRVKLFGQAVTYMRGEITVR